jgi:hypothetical protein
MAHRLDHTTADLTNMRHEPDTNRLVLPAHRLERCANLDINAKLLAQLPHQGLLRRLTGINLAAWKFPQSTKMLALRPQARKHPTPLIADDSTHDFNHDFESIKKDEAAGYSNPAAPSMK